MERDDLDAVIDDIRYLAERQDGSKIKNVLVSARPEDVAQLLVNLEDDSRTFVFSLLTAEVASDVLPELDEYTRNALIPDLAEERLSEIVDEMESDEAAGVVAELPDSVAESILESIDAADSAEVRELLQYPEQTAGRIMQLEMVAVPEDSTIVHATQMVRRRAEESGAIYNVYAVDHQGRLAGVLSLKTLVLARESALVSEVMEREVLSVYADVDQEEVGRTFRKYNLVAMPVVDRLNRLLGRITVDDVIHVLVDEASEDIHRMAGLGPEEEYRETSALRTSRARMPWLLVGLLGGILAAVVLSRYEQSLERAVGLAFFVPVVMAMGGNSGFQAATIVIRGLATGEIGMRGVGLRLLKELRVAVLNATLCAAFVVPIVGLWQSWSLAGVLSLTLLAVMVVAASIGALVPFALHRLRIDPSLATGPFITTSNDILALVIYLTIAFQLLKV